MSSRPNILRMGRRRFLQAVGAITVSTGFIGAETAPDGTEYDPENEVPRLHGWKHTNHEEIVNNGAAPDREPIYGAIPREQWRAVEAASDLRNRVKNRLRDLNPPPRVTMRVPEDKGPLDRRTIVVKHVTVVSARGKDETVLHSPAYSYEKLKKVVKERFPDEMDGAASRENKSIFTVEGMPIKTEKTIQSPSSIDYFDYEYRPVPGGCLIDVDNGSTGTLGTLAFDSDTFTYVFVSAGHLLDNGGDDVYQETNGDSNDSLGSVNTSKVKVVNSGKDFDAGIIFGLDLNANYKFADDSPDSYHGPEIAGTLSETGVKDMQGTDETMYKQGCAEGLVTDSFVDVSGDMFETFHSEDNGDSGGPYWVERDGDALITGIHHGESGIYSLATMMASIESEFNVNV